MPSHWFSSVGYGMEARPCSSSPKFLSCTFNVFAFAPTLGAVEQVWVSAVHGQWQRALTARCVGVPAFLCHGCWGDVGVQRAVPEPTVVTESHQGWATTGAGGSSTQLSSAWGAAGTENPLACLTPHIWMPGASAAATRGAPSVTGLFCHSSCESEPEFVWAFHLLRAVRVSSFPDMCKGHWCVGNTLSTKAGPQGAPLQLQCHLEPICAELLLSLGFEPAEMLGLAEGRGFVFTFFSFNPSLQET